MSGNAICTVCRRRKPIYFHRFSGDKLCLVCFEKRLAKYVRKSFGKYGLAISRRIKLAYIVHPILFIESIAMLRVFSIVEKGYTDSLLLLWPKNKCSWLQKEAINRSIISISNVVEYEIPFTRDPCRLERLLRRDIKLILEEDNTQYHVVIPIPREYVVQTALYGLTKLEKWCLYDAVKPVINAGMLRFIKPFYEISWEDMLTYAVLQKVVHPGISQCKWKIEATLLEALADVIASGGPELVYSSTTLLLELTKALEEIRKCAMCGGPMDGRVANSVCEICGGLH